MADAPRARESQTHATNMDYTLKELQRKIREHETQLEKLRATSPDVPGSAAGQADLIRTALDDVSNSEPFLPFAGSILPALLALRKTHQTIEESKAFLASHKPDVQQAERQLEADQANLRDQKLLNDALEARIAKTKEELSADVSMRPEDAARKRLAELQTKKQNYKRDTSKLMKALIGFIDSHLAAMLAAEELGGPVVGDIMDIDSGTLATGFNAQGKVQKRKSEVNEEKRQKRLDEIWGGIDEQAGHGKQDVNEIGAAGTEMRQLTEELLNRLVEAGGDSSASYVELPRESAAARFLQQPHLKNHLVVQTNMSNISDILTPTEPSTATSPPAKRVKTANDQNGTTMTAPPLQVKKLSDKARVPTRGSAFAAGYDIYAARDTTVPARGKVLVDTDIAIAVPEGTYGRIAPRSGLASKHFIDTGAGVIDADYRGQVKVLLFNHADADYEIKEGDRIAQLVLERIYTPEVVEVQELEESVRGAGGFGSTG
ncbi:Deoxyuridine 5'-triphosphate nucleotidohydrolase [Paramyrothecium foliicola]|nr:Deoxyuridine 5'-triphosphate nucleotidohydrolase [Paramyrothecium foliicola]